VLEKLAESNSEPGMPYKSISKELDKLGVSKSSGLNQIAEAVTELSAAL
jgi:hypothetical protein